MQPIVHTDLFRSLATLVGHDVPENAAEDSYDLLPALLGTAPDKPIRDHIVHHSSNGTFAIRQGRWKLILGRGSGGFTRYKPPKDSPKGQLYDLVADPGERENLYARHPDIVKRLSAQLSAMR